MIWLRLLPIWIYISFTGEALDSFRPRFEIDSDWNSHEVYIHQCCSQLKYISFLFANQVDKIAKRRSEAIYLSAFGHYRRSCIQPSLAKTVHKKPNNVFPMESGRSISFSGRGTRLLENLLALFSVHNEPTMLCKNAIFCFELKYGVKWSTSLLYCVMAMKNWLFTLM